MIQLTAEPLSSVAFAPYGQVIWPQADNGDWQPEDAELHLNEGPPRLYLMRLQAKGLRFHELAAHQHVTQCLGVMEPHPWHLAVVEASHPASQPMDTGQLRAFTVPPLCIVKLHRGTWHAGPLFADPAELVFCNLELHDTNSRDRLTLPLPEQREAEIRP